MENQAYKRGLYTSYL